MLWAVLTNTCDFSGSFLDNLGRGLFIGFMLVLLYTAVWIGAVAWNYAWAWIDETSPKRHNCLSHLIARLTGHESNDGFSSYLWRSEKLGQTDFIHLIPLVILFCGPMILVTLVTFYSLTLTVVVAFIFAHLTRYVRRMKKAFDKHVMDKDAHKKDS